MINVQLLKNLKERYCTAERNQPIQRQVRSIPRVALLSLRLVNPIEKLSTPEKGTFHA